MTKKPFIIDDETPASVILPDQFGRGLIPRMYEDFPVGCYAAAPKLDITPTPRDQWVERITEGNASKSFLSHIRRTSGPDGKPIPSLDQASRGYCWSHSTTMAVIIARAVMGEPYKRLSAYHIACIIKNYRDEGGWGAQSLDFVMEKGVATVQFWPEKSVDRSNDNPEMWANAALHKVTEGFADMQAAQYDRNLTEDQSMTLLLTRAPLIGDFNFWGHSVCILDPVVTSTLKTLKKAERALRAKDYGSLDFNKSKDLKVYAAAFGKKIINSWTDDWGDMGEGVLIQLLGAGVIEAIECRPPPFALVLGTRWSSHGKILVMSLPPNAYSPVPRRFWTVVAHPRSHWRP